MSKKTILSKTFLTLSVVLVALAVLMGVFSIDLSKKTAEAEEAKFVADDEIIIGHLTDVHYFPMSYGYLGDANTDFAKKVITSSKLTVESHLYVMEALEQIVEQSPEYLVVTGDLTTDGEIQAHVEVANLLRQTQNRVRENGNEDFQIFVIFGNHDLYNEEAFDYSQDGSARLLPTATRYDMTKVYSSLGYPDLSDEEIASYYDTKADLSSNLCPYDEDYVSGVSTEGIKFVNSSTASTTEIEWLYRENGAEQELIDGTITDYDQGEISYVATIKKNYVVVGIDDGVSTVETQHHLGGILHENIQNFLSAKKSAGDFEGKNLVSLSHRNVLPHFVGEDSLLKDFTFYNTFETADFLADLGIRYSYSGHMHANDIESRVSLNGNLITDVETASTTGYNSAVRYTKIERGSVGEDYAENFSTYIKKVETVDITSLVEMGYIDDAYFDRYDLEPFIQVKNGKTIITDAAGYSANKVLLKIVDNMVYSYVSVDFIGNAGAMVAGMLPEGNSIVDMVKPLAEVLINNLVIHFEDVVLADYVYGGNNDEFKSTARGAKLCGYVDELLQEALNMPVNNEGLALFDFVINSYLDHIGGRDVPYEQLSAGEKEALALFKDGTNVKKLVDILLDEESGLLRIINGLFVPIDLAKGMDDSQFTLLQTVLKILDKNANPHAVVLDNMLPGALELLAGFGLDLGIDFGTEGLQAFLNHLIDSYLTESLYTSLGEIAFNIVHSFKVDENANMENSFNGYTVYKHDARLVTNYVEGALDTTPTVDKGQLPGMITVTFGENPTTDKNIVWFTNKAIEGTDIQYVEGTTFDESKAIEEVGTYEKYVTTTANIDLGVYATLMHIEVARHMVELKGLKPATTYSYRVGSKALGYWSEVYTLTTAPEDNQAFELLLITDIQGSAKKPYSSAEAIMANVGEVFANGYDFIINCGDVVDNTRNWVQWEYYLNGGLQKYWANTTNVVANGNHDEYAYEKPDEEDMKFEYAWLDSDANMSDYNYLLLHFGLSYPAQDDSTGAYYSFDYSGVHFTVLNTNDYDEDGLGKAQVEWLVNDLQSTDKAYKVVVMHKSIYSVGSHTNDTEVVAMRKQLTKIFDENEVSIVLAGHDHTYTETAYIDAEGNVVENALNGKQEIGKGNGVLYITLGTFGDKFYNYVGNDEVPVDFGENLHDPMLQNPTFGKLVYDGEKLYYIGYEYDLETGKISEIRSGLSMVEQIAIIAGVAVVSASFAIIMAKVAKRKKK